jgi:hypothetical protein
MNLELNEEECGLLMEVLESRRQELHPEIRRCMDHDYKDMLNSKLKSCEMLLGRLKKTGDKAD